MKYAFVLLLPFSMMFTHVFAEPKKQQSEYEIRLWRVERMLEQQNEILFKHVKTLQDELSELRQMLEEQQYKLARIENQGNGFQASSVAQSHKKSVVKASIVKDTGDSKKSALSLKKDVAEPAKASVVEKMASAKPEESKLYQNAYDFVNNKQFSKAVDSFQSYLAKYPQGQYAPNAYYWLGELFLLENKQDDAKAAFDKVVDLFSEHSKAADAMFKVATIYVERHELEQARALFKQVQVQYPDSAAAGLANNRLNTL